MAMIELVDFNEFFDGFQKDRKKSTTRRSRRGGSSTATAAPKAAPVAEEVQEAVVVDETPAVENSADNASDATTDEKA